MKSESNFINRSFYLVREPGLVVKIGSTALPAGVVKRLIAEAGILLWERGHQMKVFPLGVIQNHLRIYIAAQAQKEHYPPSTGTQSAGILFWGQGEFVDPRTVKTLRLSCLQSGTVDTDLSRGRDKGDQPPDTDATS